MQKKYYTSVMMLPQYMINLPPDVDKMATDSILVYSRSILDHPKTLGPQAISSATSPRTPNLMRPDNVNAVLLRIECHAKWWVESKDRHHA